MQPSNHQLHAPAASCQGWPTHPPSFRSTGRACIQRPAAGILQPPCAPAAAPARRCLISRHSRPRHPAFAPRPDVRWRRRAPCASGHRGHLACCAATGRFVPPGRSRRVGPCSGRSPARTLAPSAVPGRAARLGPAPAGGPAPPAAGTTGPTPHNPPEAQHHRPRAPPGRHLTTRRRPSTTGRGHHRADTSQPAGGPAPPAAGTTGPTPHNPPEAQRTAPTAGHPRPAPTRPAPP